MVEKKRSGRKEIEIRNMDDAEYEIPVVYNNQQLHFNGKTLSLGLYTKKIQVDVYGVDVQFEMDEDRNFRAYIDPEKHSIDKVDKELLKEIAFALESIRQDP